MNDFERDLPANLEAERLILGWIMISGNESFAQCEAALTPEDFAIEKHRRIYLAMKSLDTAGRGIDRVTVATELRRTGELESVDGLSYLVSLDDGMPRLANVDAYVENVRNKSTLRRIVIEAQALMNRAMLAEDEPNAILANADTILAKLSMRDESQSDWMNPGQVMADYPGGLKSFITPSRGGVGIQMPWPQVNTSLCGLQSGDLMLLAGRPSHGKSAAAMQIAYEAAKVGRGVAYFSLEMSKESLVRRLISLTARVDSHRMRLGYMDADERSRVSEAAAEIESMPIWIDYRGYNTPSIRRALKKLQSRQEVSLVIIDHFHLLQSIGREEDRQRYARTADDLQRYAKEFSLPFLVLTQLNRKCEDDNRAPGMSDLAETGKLEQNADIVMFTYRPELYARNRTKDELKGIAEFIIAKQRNGPVGSVDMYFEKQYQCFAESWKGKERAA